MKKRQLEILDCVFHNKNIAVSELLQQFQISKRTLYYDISEINKKISDYGEIRNKNKELVFHGFSESNHEFPEKEKFFAKEERLNYLLYAILNEEFDKIENIMNRLQVSKNTIVNDIAEIRRELMQYDLKLEYNSGYEIVGCEKNIRELYMKLMACDNDLIHNRADKVLCLNQAADLQLTDYSVATLSKFMGFLEKRWRQENYITAISGAGDASRFSHYRYIPTIYQTPNPNETAYITLYIATLPSLKTNVSEEIIEKYVQDLVRNFENLSAVSLNDKEQFKKNIQRHIQSSYYRMKYHFPCFNPSLEEIKNNHSYLFRLVKQVVEQSEAKDFVNIREEEIGFLAMYFGANLRAADKKGKNRVLIVCPSGLMMSKMLEDQLRNYIPVLHIVGVISIHDLKDFKESDYDYIISTIPIPEMKNVILVKPILSKQNLDTLIHKFVDIHLIYQESVMNKVLYIIKENCNVLNEEKLKKELTKVLIPNQNKSEEQPMLKEVLTKNRMNRVKSCKSWEEAITIAAAPLLKEGVITEVYVQRMIESVNKFGPYMVLEDGFALPHASEKEGVKEMGMSFLFVEEEVDMKGKPIHAFVVLATVDNTTHLKALASLSELLESEKGLAIFMSGDLEAVDHLIQTQG